MLIDDVSKGADLNRLVRDRALIRVNGCRSQVILDSSSIRDACFVIEIVAGLIAGVDLVRSGGVRS